MASSLSLKKILWIKIFTVHQKRMFKLSFVRSLSQIPTDISYLRAHQKTQQSHHFCWENNDYFPGFQNSKHWIQTDLDSVTCILLYMKTRPFLYKPTNSVCCVCVSANCKMSNSQHFLLLTILSG